MMAAVAALLAASLFLPGEAAAESERLYTICFPLTEPKIMKAEECRNEECGLVEEAEAARPLAGSPPRYVFLGATDHGFLWGANYIRTIGTDRVRFLLYVIAPLTSSVSREDTGYRQVSERVIRNEFFASFVEYREPRPAANRMQQRRMVRKEVVTGSTGDFQMVDLHSAARKMKVYDNQTLFYRKVESRMPEVQCAELLWEKPKDPLVWNAASSMTMDILTGRYCRGAGK